MSCLLLSGLVSGCVCFDKRIPCIDEFYKLCYEQYEFGINDCSNKSGRLARELRRKGYSAEVLIVDKDLTDNATHAIVKTKFRGKDFYLDPTQRKCYWEIPDGLQIIRKINNIELYYDIEYKEIIRYSDSSPIK